MPDSLLRAGTCNVRTLSGRMGAVMDMATEAGIHILCLQETKLTSEGIHALRQAFRHRGWRFLPGELHFDQQGKASGGVAIVADWPVELVDCPLAASYPGRIMAVKAHRPGQRPVLVINGYLPANDAPLNTFLCKALVEWATGTGEDYIILADWNREPKEQPLCNMLAAGAVYALDPDPHFDGMGTHRLEDGTYTGKTIDFGIASVGIGAHSRTQRLGPADHDLVAYDIPLTGTRRGWRWQPRRLLDGEKKFGHVDGGGGRLCRVLAGGQHRGSMATPVGQGRGRLGLGPEESSTAGRACRPVLTEGKPPTVQAAQGC